MTLRLSVTNKTNLSYESLTKYFASKNGVVDLSENPPIGHPEYDQANPMGIFWSMLPLPTSYDRFWTSNVKDGLFCTFEVYDGKNNIH